MFLPSFVPGSCKPQYVRNEDQARLHLNAIPLENFGTGWRVYFPRPWQVIALFNSPMSDILDTGDSPGWPMSMANFADPAVQQTFRELPSLFQLELCLASMMPLSDDPFNQYPVTYVDGGVQHQSYRGYFTRRMNDEQITTRQQWFNPMMITSSIVNSFLRFNGGMTTDAWLQRFFTYAEFLSNHLDQRLMGAPGVYTIQDATSTYQWELESEFKFIVTG